MAAIVLSLVYRQVGYLSEVLRILELEELMWVEALSVSQQTLSQRLMSLPADVFVALFNQVVERIRATPATAELSQSSQAVQQQFEAVWIADGSSLEHLQRHLGQLQAAQIP